MLSCKDVSHLAHDLVDKKLPLGKRISVRIHLFICVRCRVYVDQVRKTVATLKRLGGSEQADAASVEKTLEHLDQQGLGPKSK